MPARLDKLALQLDLIREMASTSYGLTLEQIGERLGAERRTCERVLDALRHVFGERLRGEEGADRRKLWRIAAERDAVAMMPTMLPQEAEVHELTLAARSLAESGFAPRAAVLRGLLHKLQLQLADQRRRQMEVNLEARLASEGLVARPGPAVALRSEVLEPLREALLTNRRLVLGYRSAGKAAREHEVEPVGLLYGARPYLLAVKTGKPDAAVWRLDRIDTLRMTDGFVRPAGQELGALAAESFGVWREKPMDVVLRFTPAAAPDARAWRFHASQALEDAPDGGLVVRFRAGGVEEMALHLVSWGEAVTVAAPERLRQRLAEMGQRLAAHHA